MYSFLEEYINTNKEDYDKIIEDGGIKTTDTLIVRAALDGDNNVTFSIDPNSGCKTKTGGAIC